MPYRDRYRALVLAAGLGGLRQGELFALRWDDVDLNGASIAVRCKRLRLASGEVIETTPRAGPGRRTVALPAVLAAELERHRIRYGREADYVFRSEEGMPPERSNFRQRVWLPAATAAGLEGRRFHDLRVRRGNSCRPHRSHDQGTHGPPRPRQSPGGDDVPARRR